MNGEPGGRPSAQREPAFGSKVAAMNIIALVMAICAAALAGWWLLLPRLLARSIRPVYFSVASKDEPRDRAVLISQCLGALDAGARLVLCHPRRRWAGMISNVESRLRPLV